MYRIPRQWHHSTGIQFESIDALESLRLIEPIVSELGYTGQISFDFLVTDDGLSFVECNPRATDGLLLLDSEQLARGLLDPEADTFLLPPGETTQLDLALVGDAFSDQLKRVPQTIRDLARFKDAGDGWHDPLPTLYSAFSLAHFAGVSHREHAELQDAMDADMSWDGEPIKGMSDADAKLLAELTARLISQSAKAIPRPVGEHVERVRVAALDEALVELVGPSRVAGREIAPRPSRPARARAPGTSAQAHSAASSAYSLKWAITRVNAGSSGPTLSCAER